METAKKIVHALAKISRIVSGVLTVGLMLFVLVDVILRLLFSSGFKFSYDLCIVLLMIITYFAMVPTQTEHKHLHVTLIVRLLPKKVAYVMWGIFELLSCGICVYLLKTTIVKVSKDAGRHVMLNILGAPLAPFEYAACVGLAIFCVALLFGAIESFMALKDKKYDEVMKNILAN